MSRLDDGPVSGAFRPVLLRGGVSLASLRQPLVSRAMEVAAKRHAPSGHCVCRGIPFDVRRYVLLGDDAVSVAVTPFAAPWVLFLHAADSGDSVPEREANGEWLGRGRQGERTATYVVCYEGGKEERVAVRRRMEVGVFQKPWGDNCMLALGDAKPRPVRAPHEQRLQGWGWGQARVVQPDAGVWTNWVWAWENPRPRLKIAGFRFEPGAGRLLLSALTAGFTEEHPLRWGPRRKALLRLPPGTAFDPVLDEAGGNRHVRIDLGQIISLTPRPAYPDREWGRSYNNQIPPVSNREILVEYAAHPEACFHLEGGRRIPVARLERRSCAGPLSGVRRADRKVTFRIRDKASRRPVAAKLHLHGETGEYLAPVDRHRIPNPAWFEDYSVDFAHGGQHYCTYVDGATDVFLPLGKVFVEVSKGFEIRPVRQVVRVTPGTREIVIEIEKVLSWRERGWITADTHVHFLSPPSARLEGAGEGVNLVNLLASQWGELMTNVGDFDGKTTFGSREAGGDGEYLVRVGTENRQHILGHISLLGYGGRIIAPMTTGGPDESALGDPVGTLLTEWAMQCRRQGGVVVIPHFPNPRAEHAATIATGNADGVEMTSWGSLYAGIDPYSLLDWYRYLNCGYRVAAVGGTDKMSASTAVGTVRTYARIRPGRRFSHAEWLAAVQRAETFVTYGPLMDFAVEGRPCGSEIRLGKTGGTLDVTWSVASVTVPMSRVELIVNGEVRESVAVSPEKARGRWRLKVDRGSWAALLVRGHYADKPEIVAAHSSPVMIPVEGTEFYSAADALTILEQIEGAVAYLDTLGTRAETSAYRRMKLLLTSAGRRLHNTMHAHGHFHRHVVMPAHAGHGSPHGRQRWRSLRSGRSGGGRS